MSRPISKFFSEDLLAPLKNVRWSWGSRDDRGRVILRVWDDEITQGAAGERVVVCRPKKSWRSSNGYTERQAQLGMLRAGAAGFAVVCDGTGAPGGRRTIRGFDEGSLLLLGGLFDERDGTYAEVLGRISIEEFTSNDGKHNAPWTDDEYRDSVDEYVQMLTFERAGKTYVKKDAYRRLSQKHGRTEKSFEFRMQNISYVLALLGRPWLHGLLPASHVAVGAVAKIENLIAGFEGHEASGDAAFEAAVKAARAKAMETPPSGVTEPAQTTSETTRYVRDPRVKAWVLHKADGKCENCGKPAPFTNLEGDPFLEVHHVIALGEGGSDSSENAVAVCPNCHRAFHFSGDREALAKALYVRVSRLV